MPQTPNTSGAKKGTAMKQEVFTWQPLLSSSACQRMLDFFSIWERTKYMPGNRVRGVGTDCAQLVPAFLDYMYRTGRKTPIPRMAPDTGVHNRKAAWGTVRAVRQAFPSHVVRDGTIEPGDIVLTRATHDWTGPNNPGHAMIAMPKFCTAMHAMPNTGVCMTSLEVSRGIVRVYRLEGKEKWE